MQTQFVRENMNQYFVIDRSGEWEDSYEEKLFCVTKIPYFMSYDIRQLNGSAAFYYHMIFKTSLKQAFDCVVFTTGIIENIIKSIVGVLETCNEYLIEPENVLFDPECVFLDIESGMLKFCYYCDKKNGKNIRELVMEILQHVDKKYEQGSVKLLKFYHLLTEFDVSVEKLRSYLAETGMSETYEGDMLRKNILDADKEKEAVSFVASEDKSDVIRDKKLNKNEKGKKGILRIIKILMVIVVLSDIGLFAGLLFNLLTYDKMGYLFIGMAVLIGLVIIYMHFEPEETPDDIMAEYAESIKDTITEGREKTDYVKFEVEKIVENNVENDDFGGATVLLGMEPAESSECAAEECSYRLYLKPSDKDKYSPIYFNNPSVLIGSMRESCDYLLKEREISRLHAKIFYRNDGYYVMDMNSTNGTSLNGDIINALEEYQIREGDLLSFADIEYYVMRETVQ